MDARDIDICPSSKVFAKGFGVSRFLLVIHFLVNGRVELIERALPVDAANEIRVAVKAAGEGVRAASVDGNAVRRGLWPRGPRRNGPVLPSRRGRAR